MEETVGGYDYKYITEVPEDLICSLCHFPFKNPIHVEECGHIYCKECFEQTKDHAEENALDFCCPLDRQKVDVTRVFRDKFHERKVLSLKVECKNIADRCSWTGELRDAIDHERKCVNNGKLLEIELKKISSYMKDLELQVKCHEQRLEEKDREMANQKKQMEDYSKQLKYQNKIMVNQMKQLEDQNKIMANQLKQMEDQTKVLENQNKQIKDYSKQLEDQSKLTENCKKKIKNYSKQIEDQNILIKMRMKQLEDQNSLIKIQNMEMESLKNQTSSENQENKKLSKELTDLKQQVGNLNKQLERKIDNQREKQKVEEKKILKVLNNMIMTNVNVDPNFVSLPTAFRWKVYFTPEVFCKVFFSPPFYNIMNGMCFQLEILVTSCVFFIKLRRYRGKYDHLTNEIPTTQPFELILHIFGDNKNLRKKFSNVSGGELTIPESKIDSNSTDVATLNRDEVSRFAIDDYVHMHLFFNNFAVGNFFKDHLIGSCNIM